VPSPAIVHEYDAARRRRGILRHLGPVVSYPALAWQQRLLVQNFFRRELLGRFRGSFLGVFWVLVHPIFLFAIYYVVFGYFFRVKWNPLLGRPDPEFAVYLFSGIIVYTAFMEATGRACTVITDNGNLVKKVAFPCELLPLHLGMVSLMVYLVGAVVLLVVGGSLGNVVIGAKLLLWPVVLVIHAALALGIGLLLACLHVFMRDMTQIWGILSQAWLFLSPVFWHVDQFKAQLGSAVALLYLNPIYPLIQAHRHVLGVGVKGELTVDEPLGQVLLLSAAWALFFLLLGYGVFMSRREKFADLV
jgi:lipopolysaccharide transport system permease protein